MARELKGRLNDAMHSDEKIMCDGGGVMAPSLATPAEVARIMAVATLDLYSAAQYLYRAAQYSQIALDPLRREQMDTLSDDELLRQWNGAIESLDNALARADGVVIDLRTIMTGHAAEDPTSNVFWQSIARDREAECKIQARLRNAREVHRLIAATFR